MTNVKVRQGFLDERLKSTALIETCFLTCMHRETSQFKQSVLTLVLPVSSSALDNNIITLAMTLYEDTKPIAHVLLHPMTFLPDVRMQTL